MPTDDSPYLVLLGIAQDGGVPQAGCARQCCREAWADPDRRRHVACVAIVDPRTRQRWLIDATPDFRAQLRRLDEVAPPEGPPPALAGILLTHAHVGHYTGLMFLGPEAIGADGVPVHVMPRMRGFLRTHEPWRRLVEHGHITLLDLAADVPVALNDRITATPLLVPHRDELSETVGHRIEGPRHSVLYIPDIDKWTRWDRNIADLVAGVDVAYLDGTFHADREIRGRAMASIPHPFIVESIQRFETLPAGIRSRIRFIHLNHTNPALDSNSDARRVIEAAGHRVAEEGERVAI